jgi:hypothetical protein
VAEALADVPRTASTPSKVTYAHVQRCQELSFEDVMAKGAWALLEGHASTCIPDQVPGHVRTR